MTNQGTARTGPLSLLLLAACGAAPEAPRGLAPTKIVTVPADVLTDVDATYAAGDPSGFQAYDVGRTKQLQFDAYRLSNEPPGPAETMHAAPDSKKCWLYEGPVENGKPSRMRVDYRFYAHNGTAYVDRYGASASYVHDLDLDGLQVLEVLGTFSFARFFEDNAMDVVLHVQVSEGTPPKTRVTLVRMKIKEIEDCLTRGGH